MIGRRRSMTRSAQSKSLALPVNLLIRSLRVRYRYVLVVERFYFPTSNVLDGHFVKAVFPGTTLSKGCPDIFL